MGECATYVASNVYWMRDLFHQSFKVYWYKCVVTDFLAFKLYLFYMHVCVGTCAHVEAREQLSEVGSHFLYVNLGVVWWWRFPKVVRFHRKSLYLLSHFTGHKCCCVETQSHYVVWPGPEPTIFLAQAQCWDSSYMSLHLAHTFISFFIASTVFSFSFFLWWFLPSLIRFSNNRLLKILLYFCFVFEAGSHYIALPILNINI